jgi:enoyl-CoA hydratase/carnithine racemase
MTDAAAIQTSIDDRVLVVTFDRVAKKNALTLAMYEALVAALGRARDDAAIRVVLVRGKDGVFTAGNDLMDFMQRPPTSADSPVGRFLELVVGFAKPLVAAVEGPAIGVGTTMLLHCDLVYAAEGARFQLPFVPLGLCPEAASSALLPALAGRAIASELLLLGERFDPELALRIGLVNRVLPASELYEHALARAKALAELPPASVRLTKELMRTCDRASTTAALVRESEVFFERLKSPEAAEAMQAFFAKRKPDFSRFE